MLGTIHTVCCAPGDGRKACSYWGQVAVTSSSAFQRREGLAKIEADVFAGPNMRHRMIFTARRFEPPARGYARTLLHSGGIEDLNIGFHACWLTRRGHLLASSDRLYELGQLQGKGAAVR